MTDIASSWKKTVRRHPRALPIIVLTLWCTQLLHWGIWEFRRKPIKKTPSLSQAITQEAGVHIEPPILMADPHNIPASPFTTQFPIDDGSDSDSYFRQLGEPKAGIPHPIVDPPKFGEDPPPVEPPQNPAKALETLRYSGFMQTTHGVRVAFIEDETAQRMLRIQVGDSIEDWELVAIARDRIIFTSEKELPVEILRDFRETELEPEEESEPKVAEPETVEPKTTDETPEKETPDQ